MSNVTMSNVERAPVEVQDVKIGGHYWSATVYADLSARVYCDGDVVVTPEPIRWDPETQSLEGCYGLDRETALDDATAHALAAARVAS